MFDYYNQNKNQLLDKMVTVASTDTDDLNKKSYLFLTDMNGNAYLSLESPNQIIDSEYISSKNAKVTTLSFLEILETL